MGTEAGTFEGSDADAHGGRWMMRRRTVALIGGLIVAMGLLAACQPHDAVLEGQITDVDAGRIAGIPVAV